MKLRHRIWVIIAVAVLGTIAVSSFGLYSLRQTMMDERQAQISTLLGYGRGILEYYQGQEASGKLTREEAQAKAKDAFSALRNGTDYFFVRNTENMLLVHPDPKRVGIIDKGSKLPDGRYTSEAYAEILAKADQGSIPILTARPGDPTKQQVEKLNGVLMFHPWKWIVGTGFFIDDIEKTFWQRAIGFMLIGGTLAIVVTGAALILSRGILRQLGGEPADAANIMEKVATGDLSQQAATPPGNSLLGSLGSMVVALRALLSEINGNANQLARNAEQIKSAAQQINGAAENQSDATSSMAAAIQELAVSSSHISERARDTEKDSREAIKLAGEGRQRADDASEAIQSVASAVSGASARIHALEERANQISSIAGVIKAIAGQTNLLALNAAIEAARAGEQGRGFAVVADEVGKLAERTSLATAEIEQMVTGIQSDTVASVHAMNAVLPKVEQGVALANAASDSLHGIESGANRMLENICEVANATSEQSSASTSIAQRVEEISQMVEETTASIRETANTASELDSIAQGLKAQISRFKV